MRKSVAYLGDIYQKKWGVHIAAVRHVNKHDERSEQQITVEILRNFAHESFEPYSEFITLQFLSLPRKTEINFAPEVSGKLLYWPILGGYAHQTTLSFGRYRSWLCKIMHTAAKMKKRVFDKLWVSDSDQFAGYTTNKSDRYVDRWELGDWYRTGLINTFPVLNLQVEEWFLHTLQISSLLTLFLKKVLHSCSTL